MEESDTEQLEINEMDEWEVQTELTEMASTYGPVVDRWGTHHDIPMAPTAESNKRYEALDGRRVDLLLEDGKGGERRRERTACSRKCRRKRTRSVVGL